MSRRRLVVTLVPPRPLRDELQALRRLLGDPHLERLPPHVTIVPPVNVPAGSSGPALDVLRAAARRSTPFELHLGPAGTFSPRTPTLHLSVADPDRAIEPLRASLLTGPFGRPELQPFVPHLTLLRRVPRDRVGGLVDALVGSLGPWPVRTFTVLGWDEQQTPRRWVEVLELPLGRPIVARCGGADLWVRHSSVLEPEARALLGHSTGPEDESIPPDLVTIVSDLASPDRPVAVAAGRFGSAAEIDRLVVRQDRRGVGVGRQLLTHWCSAAATAGASLAVCRIEERGVQAVLEGCGFSWLGNRQVRIL